MDPQPPRAGSRYLLDRAREKSYRVRAYQHAAEAVRGPPDELADRVRRGTLEELNGIGPKTAAIITEVATSGSTAYLGKLEKETASVAGAGDELRRRAARRLPRPLDWTTAARRST